MYLRIFGAILIIFACSSVGYCLILNHKKEEKVITQLISVLDFMECELKYRLTPLPELCRMVAAAHQGIVSQIMFTLALELDGQISPDASACMNATLIKYPKLSDRTRMLFLKLGSTLGRFDMDGQIRGIENARQLCRKEMESLSSNRDQRLKNYQTLAVCAGVALAILLI